MRVLFVLPRMVSGGVERVILNLIAEFQKSGHECALALRRAYGELLPEARSLTTVHEVAPDGLHQFVPRLTRLIRAWQPTHVVTAFADVGALTRLAMQLARSRACWVHGVHNAHARIAARSGPSGAVRFYLDNLCAGFVYRRADKVVAVSDGVRHDVLAQFHVDPAAVVTIYNPVVPAAELIPVHAPRHPPDQPFTIVGLGRLTRQKGFDVLVEAMRVVPAPWRLDIWGEGEDRSLLERQIKEAGLESSVYLRGYTNEPYEVLRAADLFVLSSRWEGLPTVLIEALACQCQIVATDCPHGPGEILLDGDLGQFVPADAPSLLAAAIRRAMDATRKFAPGTLLARAQDFSVGAASGRWMALLEGNRTDESR